MGTSWFKTAWDKFFALFRVGIDEFLRQNIQTAINIATDVVKQGGYKNTDELVRMIWARLRAIWPQTPGTWLSIIANYACDALKKSGVLPS